MTNSTEQKPLPQMIVIDSGIEAGIAWVTCQAPLWGAINGYVRVPDDHPWHGLDYDYEDVDVRVNGGLTFANGDWLGFDTMHAGDLWPGGDQPHFCRGACDCTVWTAGMVADETRRLARQIAAAA